MEEAMPSQNPPAITGVVPITCPKTGRQFSTGLLTDKPLLNGVFDVESTAHCPYCNEDHKWHPSEARYVEALPPQDWVENQFPEGTQLETASWNMWTSRSYFAASFGR